MAPRGSIRLPSSSPTSPTGHLRALLTTARHSRLLHLLTSRIRLSGLPLRIRPVFVILTALSLLALAALGFHPTLAQRIAPPVPMSDKVLHLFCFFLASAQFYAIWVVDDSAREWYWLYFPEIASAICCVLCGSIGSEFVQALLPYKEFQWGDVVANLFGTAGGLSLSRYLVRAHRRAEELRQLYEPLDEEELDDESPAVPDSARRRKDTTWDAGEHEVFGLGEDEEEEEGREMRRWR